MRVSAVLKRFGYLCRRPSEEPFRPRDFQHVNGQERFLGRSFIGLSQVEGARHWTSPFKIPFLHPNTSIAKKFAILQKTGSRCNQILPIHTLDKDVTLTLTLETDTDIRRFRAHQACAESRAANVFAKNSVTICANGDCHLASILGR